MKWTAIFSMEVVFCILWRPHNVVSNFFWTGIVVLRKITQSGLAIVGRSQSGDAWGRDGFPRNLVAGDVEAFMQKFHKRTFPIDLLDSGVMLLKLEADLQVSLAYWPSIHQILGQGSTP
jgi:hypothetical protein